MLIPASSVMLMSDIPTLNYIGTSTKWRDPVWAMVMKKTISSVAATTRTLNRVYNVVGTETAVPNVLREDELGKEMGIEDGKGREGR